MLFLFSVSGVDFSHEIFRIIVLGTSRAVGITVRGRIRPWCPYLQLFQSFLMGDFLFAISKVIRFLRCVIKGRGY